MRNQNLDSNRNFGKIDKLNTSKIRNVFIKSHYDTSWLTIIDEDNNLYHMHFDELKKILPKTNVDCRVEPAKKYNRIYCD